MKRANILVGVPGSGKSTYADKYLDGFILSTDDIIENIASMYGYTYDEFFKDTVKLAERIFFDQFDKLVQEGFPMTIDRTNLTVKSRKRFLDKLKENGYHVSAIVFRTPEETEWKKRLNSREGKTIPKGILENMLKSYEQPTIKEGFDCVEINL